jgi:hypothetical protein
MEGIGYLVSIAVILVLLELREARKERTLGAERRALKRAVDRLLSHTAKNSLNQQETANEVLHLRKLYEKTVDHFDDARNYIVSNDAKYDAILKELEIRRERPREEQNFDFVEGL